MKPVVNRSGLVPRWPSYELTPETRPAEETCGDDLAKLAYEPQCAAAVFIERARGFVDCMRQEGMKDIEVTDRGSTLAQRQENVKIRVGERQFASLLEGL
jgi:hypothetical protein